MPVEWYYEAGFLKDMAEPDSPKPVDGSRPARRRERAEQIRLDELLVRRGLCGTLSQAQGFILAGEVLVLDQVADKPGLRFTSDVPVRVRQAPLYVSRGGLKLAAALDAFSLTPSGWVCADVGASTGGFTDCLLQHGASRVYAIDVGYGQLAWTLRQDPRVIPVDRANIRYLAGLPEPVSLATIDVSFIGLDLVLPPVSKLLAPDGQIVALIKPQFEVKKSMVAKGGVVRDPVLHRAAIRRVLSAAAHLGLGAAGLVRSPITGPAGNLEFLAWLRQAWPTVPEDVLNAWLDAATIPAEPEKGERRAPESPQSSAAGRMPM